MTKVSIQVVFLYVLRFECHCNTDIPVMNKYESMHRITYEVSIPNSLRVPLNFGNKLLFNYASSVRHQFRKLTSSYILSRAVF